MSIGAASSYSVATTALGSDGRRVYEGMRRRLATLEMEVQDKAKTLSSLKDLLRNARQAGRSTEERLEQREAAKLKSVRAEYESTIQRHLGFIDRLLADKQSLSDKCDTLADEMKRVEKHFEEAKHLEEKRHQEELLRQKEALLAQEKVRRTRWIEDKRKEIKEVTIRGLEPEIQRILAKHKQEIQRLEEGHAAALRRMKQQGIDERENALQRLREQLEAGRQAALSDEIDVARSKAREAAERHEAELAELRKRFEQEADLRRNRAEDAMRTLSARHAEEVEAIREAERNRREELVHRHAAEKERLQREVAERIHDQKEASEAHTARWKEEFRQQCLRKAKEDSQALREDLVRERDAHIDMIIKKLDEEAGVAARASAAEFQRKIESMKAEQNESLRKARESESKWIDQ